MARYREPMAHRRSSLLEAVDVLCFLGLVFATILVLSIVDVR